MHRSLLTLPAAPCGDAASAMRPIRRPLLAHVSAEVAWSRLLREGLVFLVVVEGGGGRMVGVVSRQSLKPGPCCARHGSACSVVNHRAADGAYCFADEPVGELAAAEAALHQEYPYRPPRSVPLIVVERGLRPVGYLPAAGIPARHARQSAA